MKPESIIPNGYQPPHESRLNGMKILVVGGGPGGLAVARSAQANGAEAVLFEQAGDPRGKDAGYTDRSFNITGNDVGRRSVGDPRAWVGGVRVVGRAIHNFEQSGEVRYTTYGDGPEDHLTGMPRPVLRQNLATLAEEEGARLVFDANVTDFDPDRGRVHFIHDGRAQQQSGDLIVVSDGLHSISDALRAADVEKQPEPRGYVTAMLTPDTARDLSNHHLHYWHEPDNDSYVIGVPNIDGSIALLFISPFKDIDENEHPFANSREARTRLERDFPQLLAIDPSLPDQLPDRSRGKFHYKSSKNFALGPKAAKVGDAGRAAPPWAGFGANTALYGAELLVQLLTQHEGELAPALSEYQRIQSNLSDVMLEYVADHGEFLSKGVAQDPTQRSKPALQALIDRAVLL